LASPATGAFEVNALFPETDGVCLLRAHFTFTKAEKIRHPACAAIKQAA
jgi:hypothetical protein